MNDQQWDERLRTFLQKTGGELKRAGEEIKAEAQRLISEVKDPEKQKKVKEGLHELGSWARKTAEEVAEVVEKGVKKAEDAVHKATGRVVELSKAPSEPKAASKKPAAKRKPRARPAKSIGRKRS